MANARKGRVSKEADDRRRGYGRKRLVATCPTVPVVTVVCDDCRTSIAYFEALHRTFKAKITIRAVPAPYHGAPPKVVAALAIQIAKDLQAQSQRDEGDKQPVFALIDLERDEKRRSQAFEVQQKYHGGAVCVALSDPCFELWTLLHLDDTGRQFADCDAVRNSIKPLWQRKFGHAFEAKAQADYSIIVPFVADATTRAKRHCEPTKDPSWTQVYLVLEEVNRLLDQ